jgi:hypothetical protein
MRICQRADDCTSTWATTRTYTDDPPPSADYAPMINADGTPYVPPAPPGGSGYGAGSGGSTYVHGYYRRNGTYVHGYSRHR